MSAYTFVKVEASSSGIVIKDRAGEPIQYVTGNGRSEHEMAAWIDRLARQWDEHIRYSKDKAR